MGAAAVGGAATQRLARCVADGGTVVNYGALSGDACMVDNRELIFRGVSLTGFWLRRWFAETPPADIAALYRRLAGKLAALLRDMDEKFVELIGYVYGRGKK